MKYRAEFKVYAEVEFDDDGEHSLMDQAFEALEQKIDINHGFEVELDASSVQPVGAA